MRLNYYCFPDDTPETVLLEHGCEIILKNGDTANADFIPESKRDEVDHIDHSIGGLSVTSVKNLIRTYGGFGWTDHCERDGGVFETTPIQLSGNNSRFKYNHHL